MTYSHTRDFTFIFYEPQRAKLVFVKIRTLHLLFFACIKKTVSRLKSYTFSLLSIFCHKRNQTDYPWYSFVVQFGSMAFYLMSFLYYATFPRKSIRWNVAYNIRFFHRMCYCVTLTNFQFLGRPDCVLAWRFFSSIQVFHFLHIGPIFSLPVVFLFCFQLIICGLQILSCMSASSYQSVEGGVGGGGNGRGTGSQRNQRVIKVHGPHHTYKSYKQHHPHHQHPHHTPSHKHTRPSSSSTIHHQHHNPQHHPHHHHHHHHDKHVEYIKPRIPPPQPPFVNNFPPQHHQQQHGNNAVKHFPAPSSSASSSLSHHHHHKPTGNV